MNAFDEQALATVTSRPIVVGLIESARGQIFVPPATAC